MRRVGPCRQHAEVRLQRRRRAVRQAVDVRPVAVGRTLGLQTRSRSAETTPATPWIDAVGVAEVDRLAELDRVEAERVEQRRADGREHVARARGGDRR